MKYTDNILRFASGDLDIFDAFVDLFNHYQAKFSNEANKGKFEYVDNISFEEKERNLNEALLNKIIERSGVNYATADNIQEWFNHPTVRHETFAIVSHLIDAVIPQTIINSIGLYTDVRVGGWGDSFSFNVKPRDLFVVSRGGRAQKSSEVKRQFDGQVNILPESHQITVGTSLYRILTGHDSLAEFAMKAIRSIESQMTADAYNAFETAMAALDATADSGLRIAGYTQSNLIELCQRVGAFSSGRPVVVGTQLALQNVLPADANYRYDLNSEYVRMGYISTAFGYDLMAIPQLADWGSPFKTLLSDDYLWVLSPMDDKLVKLCLEGSTLSYTANTFENANLSQETTFIKSWGAAIATNSVAATITL